MSPPDMSREQRFANLYDIAYSDVLRFVRRRADFDAAEDLVHETFLIAWRRIDDVPVLEDSARAWLFGVARNCLLNDHRARERYARLGVRIADAMIPEGESPTAAASLQLDLVAAWKTLSTSHQEALSLAVWEDLPAVDAGKALGISAAAYRIRLHRARAALKRHLGFTASHLPFSPATSTTEMPA